MSALQDPIGGILQIMTSAPRGMTEWEADWFLRTGQLPDLSQPPVNDALLATNTPEITEADARAFLAGQPPLVAAGGWGSPSEIAFQFDPNQERGPDGRWIDEGGAGRAFSGVLTDSEAVLAAAPVALASGSRGTQLVCRPDSLPPCAGDRAAKTSRTLQGYRLNDYNDINGLLRSGGSYETDQPEPIVQDWIGTIDQAMADSPLDQDVRVQRGLADATGIFGNAALLDDEDLTGFEWVETAFVSTTSEPDVLDMFGTPGGMVMNIHVPAGVSAIKMSEAPRGQRFDEAELLLNRGLKMRVVADQGLDRMGRRIIDVEVVPA